MYLLVAHTDDVAALWLYRQLRQRGFRPLELLSMEQLQYNRSFTMTQQGGKAAFRIALQDGRTFSSEEVCGLLHRAQRLDTAFAATFQPADRAYVHSELSAIFTCWGSAFGEKAVFNPVTTSGFGGRDRGEAEWLLLAHAAGLPTVDFHHYPLGTSYSAAHVAASAAWEVLAFRGQCFAPAQLLTPDLAARCADLQQRSEQPLLGIRFGQTETGPVFLGATLHPDLRTGGEAFVEHLKLYLEHGLALWHTGRRPL
jgi:hypothetical protein